MLFFEIAVQIPSTNSEQPAVLGDLGNKPEKAHGLNHQQKRNYFSSHSWWRILV